MMRNYPFKEEHDILVKYKDGRLIDDIDNAIIEELASVGLIRTGFSLSLNQRTAKTTAIGMLIA
jgi:hypothetical protein